ncbi:hypothetical protein K1718_13390 [Roseibium porphyridii]|uniref:Peptidase S74 domain-containing protein n=1 Tax=Roseibium porphyridii TaxID=2866279 RepID=A0ABY8FIC0_9HYPH|nr:hypothetical protein [Roseibium sp. KMA01]WFE92313.1 hypothetical protein K1718_13390 [Roseibium sp. KMA01]
MPNGVTTDNLPEEATVTELFGNHDSGAGKSTVRVPVGSLTAQVEALMGPKVDRVDPVAGAFADTPIAVTAADDNRDFLIDTSGGNVVVNAASAAALGASFRFTVKRTSIDNNTVTIIPNGAETIDGKASMTLYGSGQSVTLISDGNNWHRSAGHGDYPRIIDQADYPTLSDARAAANAVNGIVLESSNGRLSMATNLILQTTTEVTHDGVFILSATGSETQADGAVVVGYGADHPFYQGHLFFSALTTSDIGRIFSENWHKFRRGAVFNGRWAQTLGAYDYLDVADPDGIVHIFANSGTLGTISPELPGFTAHSTGNLLVIESNASTDTGMSIAVQSTLTANIFFGDPENATVGRISYDHSSDTLFFGTNAAARLYINSNGETGLGGVPIAGTRLTVVGAGTGTGYGLRVNNSVGAQKLAVRDDGLIYAQGIYDNTTASAGNVYVASNGFLQRSTSSIFYKFDVRDMSVEERDLLLKLTARRYRSKGAHDNQDWSYYGLVAEEVAEVDPRYVHFTIGGTPDGLMYERFTAPLIMFAQDHHSRIAIAEDRLDAIEGRVTELEERTMQ